MLFAPAIARVALRLGSPEYFSLMVMSLTIVTYMVRGSMIKALGFFPLFGGTLLAVFPTILLFQSILVTFRPMGRMARGEKEKPRWVVVYAYIGFLSTP